MDTIEVRVERGFAFLTERLGPGWWDAVDVDRLELHDCFTCVLGQLAPALGATNVPPDYASYIADKDERYTDTPFALACEVLDYGDAAAVAHGFASSVSFHYELLTVAWRRRILAARDAAPVVTARAAEAVTA